MPAAPVETPAELALPGGPLRFTLRRTPRARGLRVTIHPERGIVVSVPPPTRRGWAHPEGHIERFLRERERWIRRHATRLTAERTARESRPELGAGRAIPFHGVPHLVRVHVVDLARRSRVAR